MRGVCAIYNHKALALVTRSGSHALMNLMLPENHESFVPESLKGQRWHPIMNLKGHDLRNGFPEMPICCMVRDPVDRFVSSCARRKKSVKQGLLEDDDPHFWTMESMSLLNENIKYFLFPQQINECANWLGLTIPVPKLNEEDNIKKPVLNQNEIELVLQKYCKDNELYLKLKENYHE
jgi:hypothetical protein